MFRSFALSVMSLAFSAMLFSTPPPAHAAIYNSLEAMEDARLFALDPMFQSVGMFVGTDDNGDDFVAGSGVLINPYWVLTAGHVPYADPGLLWDEMRFSTSPDVLNNLDTFISADMWMPFPGFDTATVDPGKGNDIGLARLSEPIFDVEPATRFYGDDIEGTEMVMAGYGNPGVWPHVGSFDGIRRAGQNIGDQFGSTGLTNAETQYWLSDLDQASSQNPLPLEWNSSQNDSGGGWFADIDGTMQLVGLTTFGIAHTSSGAIRVSLYNDWIDATMAENTAVPEPTSLALMTVGMLGGIGLRRRKTARR